MKTIVTVKCPVCNGNKKIVSDGMLSIDCTYCDGKGEVKAATQAGDTNGVAIKCPTCLGCGKIWEVEVKTEVGVEKEKEIVEKEINAVVEKSVEPELTPQVLRKRGRPRKL